MDEITLTLNRTITDWEWDMLTDVDFDHTSEITFHTKHGKEVKFVKESAHHEITEEEVAEYLSKNGFVVVPGDYLERLEKEECGHGRGTGGRVMTREEALRILDTIPTIGDQVDALEMAIEALERAVDISTNAPAVIGSSIGESEE